MPPSLDHLAATVTEINPEWLSPNLKGEVVTRETLKNSVRQFIETFQHELRKSEFDPLSAAETAATILSQVCAFHIMSKNGGRINAADFVIVEGNIGNLVYRMVADMGIAEFQVGDE